MENKYRRCTDKGIEQDPTRGAFDALERRLKEGENKFEYRETDDEVFRTSVECAANKFALRTKEAVEGSSEGEDGEPSGPAQDTVSGEQGNPVAVEPVVIKPEKSQDHEFQEATETTESTLVRYKGQYDALPGEVKSRCTWEELSSRLGAKEDHYMKLAMALQDGGKLVFIDKEGNPVLRDGGVEPVMKGANYSQVFEALYGEDYKEGSPYFGYEMPDSVDELRAIEDITKRPFVASDNRKEFRSSWMYGKKNASFARRAYFNPDYGDVRIFGGGSPDYENPRRGVVRLLRVKKMV